MTATRTEQPAALSTRMRTESAAAHDEAEGSRLAAALVAPSHAPRPAAETASVDR